MHTEQRVFVGQSCGAKCFGGIEWVLNSIHDGDLLAMWDVFDSIVRNGDANCYKNCECCEHGMGAKQ